MAITIIIFIMLFIIDQLTKYLSQLFLAQNAVNNVIPHVFSLNLCYNNGAAFSSFSGAGWLLIAISTIASIVLIYFCTKNDWKKEKYKSFLLTMILAGCVGNLFDRIIMVIPGLSSVDSKGIAISGRPGVVDMLKFDFLDPIWNKITGADFGICNIADLYLVIGLILFAIDLIFFADRRKKKNEAKYN